MTGKHVTHKRFGDGTITRLEGANLFVLFAVGEKKLQYPQAFENFLTTDDAELAERVAADLAAFHEREAKAAAEKQAQLEAEAAARRAKDEAGKRKSSVHYADKPLPEHPFVLDADDPISFERVFELLNVCFGTDYEAWMQAMWYPASHEFAVWTPHLSDDSQSPMQNGCMNTLSDDGESLIYDDRRTGILENESDGKDYSQRHLPRLIFAKKHNGPYIFRGLYEYDEAQSSPRHYVNRRIARKVRLVGFPVDHIEII